MKGSKEFEGLTGRRLYKAPTEHQQDPYQPQVVVVLVVLGVILVFLGVVLVLNKVLLLWVLCP